MIDEATISAVAPFGAYKAGPGDNFRKFEEMFERRLERGQQHYQPYLGCREFPAIVEAWDGSGVLVGESRDLGWVLHDISFEAVRGNEIAYETRFFFRGSASRRGHGARLEPGRRGSDRWVPASTHP